VPWTERVEDDSGARWGVRLCVAVVFAIVGGEKFTRDPHWLQVFGAIGLGDWFRYATGSLELGGGLLFLWPRATSVGAFILVATMCGAVAVQAVVFRRPADGLVPGAYLAGVLLAYWKLRPSTPLQSNQSRDAA
jgi:putative oxidoreductase